MVRLLSQSFTKSGSYKTCLLYLFIDATLISTIGIFSYVLFTGVLPPYKRGFRCDDLSIQLRYKPSTIGVKLLLAVCIGAAFLLVELAEFVILLRQKVSSASPSTIKDKLKHFLAVTTAVNAEFMLGMVIQIALMHFAKSGFGVLRPHFVDVCQPNLTLLNCSANGGYVMEPHCTAGTARELKAARESFPSGHSSTAAYTLFFVVVYALNRGRRRFRRPTEHLVLGVYAMAFSLWALVVFVTRVTDHWHHKTDVAGGIALGMLVAAILLLRKDSVLQRDYYSAINN